MKVKKKHVIVITFSSIIIAVVFISTLIGYSLYIQWKKDTYTLKYRQSIYKLTAELFAKDIAISNIKVEISKDGPFSGLAIFGGSLKNNTNKMLTSLMIEVSFLRSNGTVVYKDWIYPLGERNFGNSSILYGDQKTRKVLKPGETISFQHAFRSCPKEVVEELSKKVNFAKQNPEDKIKMIYSIEGLSVT